MSGATVEIIGTAPERQHATDAGGDLRSTINCVIMPGERKLIPTGTRINLPAGLVGYITPRSGIAYRDGVTVLNAPGTIDTGYTDELKVLLINHGDKPFEISKDDRIAQLVVQPVNLSRFDKVEVFSVTHSERGAQGFGSTGK